MRPLLVFLLFCSTSHGQIVGPTSYEAGDPVVLTVAPDGDPTVTTEHAITSDCKFLKPAPATIHAWPAAPGKHWFEDKVTSSKWESRDVLVPGPNWPTDPSDIKRETIKNLLDKTTVVHRFDFVVAGHAPQPPPGPTPPTPTPEGKRTVVIVRETEDTTPALARITTGLRAGADAKWIADRGHTLTILDDDQLPAELKAKLGALPPLPALFVIDAKSGAVVYADQLHAATSAAVVELIKQAGG